jgi:hypothetical protein
MTDDELLPFQNKHTITFPEEKSCKPDRCTLVQLEMGLTPGKKQKRHELTRILHGFDCG